MPPPESVKSILDCCLNTKWEEAHNTSNDLIKDGYTPSDIVGKDRQSCFELLMIFFVVVMKSVLRRLDNISECVCLEYLKVSLNNSYIGPQPLICSVLAGIIF